MIKFYASIWVLLVSILQSEDVLGGKKKQKYEERGNESWENLRRNKCFFSSNAIVCSPHRLPSPTLPAC